MLSLYYILNIKSNILTLKPLLWNATNNYTFYYYYYYCHPIHSPTTQKQAIKPNHRFAISAFSPHSSPIAFFRKSPKPIVECATNCDRKTFSPSTQKIRFEGISTQKYKTFEITPKQGSSSHLNANTQ